MKILPVVLSVLVLATTASAQTITVSKENRTIAITTSDDASAFADVAVVTIGFNLYGTDQQQAYTDATRTSNAIIKALTDAGIKADAIQSSSQNLSPIDENDKLHYAKGLRFEFNQSWRVTTAAKSASDVLHVAITAGANNSGGIQWQLADDNALEAEAAQKALTHARQIAERMAKGLNAKLGVLVYASNQTQPRGVYIDGFMGGQLPAPRQKELKPLAISPEKIQKSATVYAVFAIE
jgi:uncharacterized protein YggE